MRIRVKAEIVGSAILLAAVVCSYGQARVQSNEVRGLIEQGNAALAENRLHDAAEAFQKAIDLDASSAKAHEQLGVTLYKEIIAGNVRPSADTDVSERAERHLKQAIDLSASATRPLLELSELEAALAERTPDAAERSDRYGGAQDLLKQVLALKPADADIYLRLANLERDQFGPAIQEAKTHFGASNGAIPDAKVRHHLQQQYGRLIDDAVDNAKKAAEMKANSSQSLLLLSRLLRERALIRETADEYTSDMHSAEDFQRQFLTVGGHLDAANGH